MHFANELIFALVEQDRGAPGAVSECPVGAHFQQTRRIAAAARAGKRGAAGIPLRSPAGQFRFACRVKWQRVVSLPQLLPYAGGPLRHAGGQPVHAGVKIHQRRWVLRQRRAQLGRQLLHAISERLDFEDIGEQLRHAFEVALPPLRNLHHRSRDQALHVRCDRRGRRGAKNAEHLVQPVRQEDDAI